MGNICSNSKNEAEPFSRPGRVLGSSATDSVPRASVPATAKSKSKSTWESPGRTLGDGGGSGGAGSGSGPGPGTEKAEDARARAAAAAQKRAEATSNANKGKLGSKLAAQKAQTQAQTLNEASRDERAARDADGAEAARRWE
ncbi:uncharacterized protein BJX67DRAFT_341489 [Aspergillus lucknowensis]|uniref:Uncharacterized protein n=1 Tax=Aspergillus lucknowensis TaxID=176173 RepID=A0ABR4M675_9EURO